MFIDTYFESMGFDYQGFMIKEDQVPLNNLYSQAMVWNAVH